MSPVVGHAKAREHLYGCYLAPVTLLQGPESVGKWTIAREYIRDREVGEFDVLEVPVLTALQARVVVKFCQTAPVGSTAKVVLINLDGAVEQASTILLKTLEEPPDTVRFILVASGPVLPTIASRAQVIRFGVLSDGEVQAILQSLGVDASRAQDASRVSGGRVRPALEAAGGSGAARAAVEAALRAARAKDTAALARAFREWGEAEHRLLLAWAAESSVREPVRTIPVDLGRTAGRWILMLLGTGRPSLCDRAALESYMTGDERR